MPSIYSRAIIFWCTALSLLSFNSISAQGILDYISGSIEANGNVFIRDDRIGASNTPQYDHQLFGADAWFDLRYSQYGFDAGFRFDLFNNSNLLNPMDSYTDEGIGMWYVHKRLGKLDATVGYIYDEIGSGLIFRSYEVRPLLIDNALIGLKLEYEFTPNLTVKAFTGRQKQQFDVYQPVVTGGSINGFFSWGEETYWSLSPGIGAVNRTLDDATVEDLIADLKTYTPQDSVGLSYNTYALSAFNTLTVDNFTWYVEAGYKTPEIFFDPFAKKLNWDGSISNGKYVRSDGYVLYSSMSYAQKGLGVTLDIRRMNNFEFRVSPFSAQLQGLMNFMPPLARQNTYRLTARYNAVPQFLGEMAYQADIKYAFNKSFSMGINGSFIDEISGRPLYREVFLNASYKKPQEFTLNGGVQLQFYNQEVYEIKPGTGIVQTITPFIDYLHKFSRRHALRVEAQYMYTGADWSGQVDGEVYREFGDWLFLQAEYSIAPRWTFFASDMWNIVPKKTEDIHYYSAGFAYTQGANRFALSYVKQVEGVVCTGGVCRVEPAFNGIRLNVNANF